MLPSACCRVLLESDRDSRNETPNSDETAEAKEPGKQLQLESTSSSKNKTYILGIGIMIFFFYLLSIWKHPSNLKEKQALNKQH